MAYPTPEGIGEAAVGSGMAAIQFMLAAQMELLKEYEEASRVWMSEVKLWSKLAVKSSTRASILPISILTRWQQPLLARQISRYLRTIPRPSAALAPRRSR